MRRRLQVLGHLAGPVFPVLFVAGGLWNLVSDVGNGFITLVLIALFVANIATHARRLCPHCMATMPLDPQAAVLRDARWLRFAHRYLDHPVLTLGLVVVVAVPASTYLSEAAQFAFCVLPIGAWQWALYRHHRLQPWCPWCRGWDDQDEELPVAPPSPSRTR